MNVLEKEDNKMFKNQTTQQYITWEPSNYCAGTLSVNGLGHYMYMGI